MYSSKNKQSSRLSRLRQPLPIICGLIIIIIAVMAGLELTNTTHIFHKKPLKKTAVIATTSPVKSPAKPKAATAKSPVANSVAATTPDSSKGTITSGNSSAALTDPYGDFVSNHKVNLGDTEYSVCNTTPGATCTITFTLSGGITRSLAPQIADSNGSASWGNWIVKDSNDGFSNGSWTIKATASLNGQTKTVTDTRLLEIGS